MPDHIHFFCSPGSFDVSLQRFVSGFKQNMTRFAWSNGHRGVLWQREFHDHLLRNSELYVEKWEYVRLNPVRAQLVMTPGEWPYQGELEVLQVR
jgi:putative transposase